MAKKRVSKKLLRLKPGNHQFIPGEYTFHNNDNTSSAELEWYLDRYPHISFLLEQEQVIADVSADESQE